MMELKFEMKYKEYELRACPKRLRRFDPQDKDETIEFVKWCTAPDGQRHCYTIAYFQRNSDNYWALSLVGNRFFTEVDEKDYTMVMNMLKSAYNVLTAFAEEGNNDY